MSVFLFPYLNSFLLCLFLPQHFYVITPSKSLPGPSEKFMLGEGDHLTMYWPETITLLFPLDIHQSNHFKHMLVVMLAHHFYFGLLKIFTEIKCQVFVCDIAIVGGKSLSLVS